MAEPYQQTAEQILQQMGVSSDAGLSARDVARRRDRYGPNRLRQARQRAAWRILLDQVKSIVVILLLAATLASAAFGRLVEAAAIFAAVLVNTVIGFAMELHATRAMEALRRMDKVTARVRREGQVCELAADELLPGDLLLLEAGDAVAADVRLLEANRLQCNESALTGESVPVNKTTAALPGDEVPLGDRSNMAWKGTAVTQGSGSGVVVATGMDTELGNISSLVEEAEHATTPLEKRLDRLGRRLIWLTLVVAAVVAATGLVAGKDWVTMLETAIALAIAAVPEGLPVVATLALAQGMRRMARRNAVVKQLTAVEALGAVNLLFTDKTGTLTENHMTVDRLALARGTVELRRDAEGGIAFEHDDRPLQAEAVPGLRAALEVGALCNNASLDAQAVGDPTELALLEIAADLGIDRDRLLEEQPETHEESFDPETMMMATFHRWEGCYRIAVKGAPEAVLKVCTAVLENRDESSLNDAGRKDWQRRSEELAGKGLRVLALAQKWVDDDEVDPYRKLTLLGLAGLYDPPRKGIREAIAACQAAGIRVVMGTGDHAATAQAIAAEIGLTGDKTTTVAVPREKTGELDEAQRERLERAVFARISPEQKLDLIRLYQKAGLVVGMTGDGVNDAPALKKADIGIAMGQRGTQVAREAADMVLKDDAFATIVAAVEHGRTIFRNIRRFILYLLSGNLGEIMAVAAAALVNAPLPLLPLQILYINFVSDVLPALALGLTRGEANVMQRPPRDPNEPILPARHWYAISGYAVLIAAAVLGAFALAIYRLEMDTLQAVTVSFLTFGFARLWHLFNMRAARSSLLVNEITTNPFAWLAIVLGAGLMLAATYLPVLANVLSIHPPAADGWFLLVGFSLLPLLVVQLMKLTGLLWEAHDDRAGGISY
jgi:Ca2+-transporting ATPase